MMNARNRTPEWLRSENLRWAAWAWDHDVFYQRLGAKAADFLGNTRWLEAWWSRVHSEELVRKMADMGITVVVTHFFKGMGRCAEKTTIDALAGLVKVFHDNGIRVIGYTMGSVFYETFLKEVPEAVDWPQRNYDGSIKKYAGCYYRWKPCVNSGYIGYLKQLVEFGVNEIGLDGFHFDNAHVEACYCENCREKFRDYLEANIDSSERLGFVGFNHVQPPPPGFSTRDPLVQEWIRFRVRNVANRKQEVYDHIKQIDDGLCVLANPGFPREGNWAEKWGLDPYYFGKAHDLVFAENANTPQYAEGRLVHQVRAYKFAEAGGYTCISSSWRKDENGVTALPEKDSEIMLSLLEPAVLNNGVGINWPVRSVGGSRLAIDDNKLALTVERTFGFLERHRSLFAESINQAATGLLHSFESMAFAGERVYSAYNGMEQILVQKSIPYRLVYTRDIGEYGACKLLIAANLCCLSDSEVEGMRDFVNAGGRLLLTGNTGCYDENYLAREDNPFAGLEHETGVRILRDSPELPQKVRSDSKWLTQFATTLPERWPEITTAIEELLPNEAIPVRIDGPESVVMFVRELPGSNRVVLHLLDYDLDNTLPRTVTLYPAGRFSAFQRCVVYTLDAEQRTFDLDAKAPSIDLLRYACVVLL